MEEGARLSDSAATKNRAGTRSMFFLLSTLYFAVATPIRELDTPVLDTLSLER